MRVTSYQEQGDGGADVVRVRRQTTLQLVARRGEPRLLVLEQDLERFGREVLEVVTSSAGVDRRAPDQPEHGRSLLGVLAWLLYGVFVGVAALWAEQVVRDEVLRLDQLVAQLALTPVLAVFAIEVGMAISARSTDIRVAQQLSGLAMLPIFALIALFSFGVIEPSVSRYLVGAAVLAAVDRLGWRVVTGMFDRERVLTRAGAG